MKKGYFVSVEYGPVETNFSQPRIIKRAHDVIIVEKIEDLKAEIDKAFTALAPPEAKTFGIIDVRPL